MFVLRMICCDQLRTITTTWTHPDIENIMTSVCMTSFCTTLTKTGRERLRLLSGGFILIGIFINVRVNSLWQQLTSFTNVDGLMCDIVRSDGTCAQEVIIAWSRAFFVGHVMDGMLSVYKNATAHLYTSSSCWTTAPTRISVVMFR
jgi:hypothetical protein